MIHIDRGAAGRALLAGSAMLLAACGEPTGVEGSASTFTADVRGSITETLTGSAAVGGSGDLSRQGVFQVTLPNGGTFTTIALSSAAPPYSGISLNRSGTELPTGTHRIGRLSASTTMPLGGFTAAYVVREPSTMQIFAADSGTITITGSGSRVTGSFTMYANSYDVIPTPTPDMVGKPITPIERGSASLTISGTFDAGRRRR
jgi:hypothetical protein